MILVDTSVWIDYFRGAGVARPLADLLEHGEVLVHPFVRGELALGALGRRRAEILGDLAVLPRASILSDDDVLHMVEGRRLASTGIGWVDAHLVAAALHDRAALWTRDWALARVAGRVGVAADA